VAAAPAGGVEAEIARVEAASRQFLLMLLPLIKGDAP
jgi:hypothetical protein